MSPALMQVRDAARSLAISRAKFFELAKAEHFPRPRYLDSRPRWLVSELEEWAKSRPTERGQE